MLDVEVPSGSPAPPPSWVAQLKTGLLWSAMLPSSLALFLDLFVLVIAVVGWRKPHTRSIMRRQSLYMLLVVQVIDAFNSITFMSSFTITKATTNWCWPIVGLSVSFDVSNHFLIMFIAVNLQLIVVHGVSTTGFIKYYVGGAWLVTAIIMAVSAANNVWGWEPKSQTCFMALSDPARRRFWNIASLHAWTLLSMTICLVCTACVLVRLLRTRAYIQQALAASTQSSKVQMHQLNHVAWRICVYPAILIFVNAVGVPATIYINSSGPLDSGKRVLLCIQTAIYALGHMLLGLTAIFIDPAFSTVVKMVLFSRSGTTSTAETVSISFTRSVEVALSPLNNGKDVIPKHSHRFKSDNQFQEADLDSKPFDSPIRKSLAFVDNVRIVSSGDMGLPLAQVPRAASSRASPSSPTLAPNLEDL